MEIVRSSREEIAARHNEVGWGPLSEDYMLHEGIEFEPGRETHHVRAPDGGRLAIEITQPPDNGDGVEPHTVFILGGTPSSLASVRPQTPVPHGRIVSLEKTGYGDSHRVGSCRRTVHKSIRDVMAVIDYLDVYEASYVVRSGSGPVGLGLSAELGEVFQRGTLIAPIIPRPMMAKIILGDRYYEDYDWTEKINPIWYQGMGEFNAKIYEDILDSGVNPDNSRCILKWAPNNPRWQNALRILSELEVDIKRRSKNLASGIAEPDNSRAGITPQTLLGQSAALKTGSCGRAWDIYSQGQDPRINLRKITKPVELWIPAEDEFSPNIHAEMLRRELGALALPIREPGTNHLDGMHATTEAIARHVKAATNRRN